LLPLQARYGRIQRDLAAKQGVALIPKRILGRVLSARDATIDGLHLSTIGSQLMAEAVLEVIGPLLKQNSPP
jgi:lysophospholipase L1-like esterase